MNWCCEQLKANSDKIGFRGISVQSEEVEDEGAVFFLEGRALDIRDENGFEANSNRPMAIKSKLYIFHCPWCGTNLKDFYGARLCRPSEK
jgi:hypothetical protein